MKLSLAVGILSSQTLLPILSEAKVLSTKMLDSDDPRSPFLRGGSNLMHVGSTTTTTPFKKKTNKKVVECIPPPQGELMEEDYDLGVLSCTTSSTTIVGQICVPSDDSTLGGYCMDPLPPLTYSDGRARQLGTRRVKSCKNKSCNAPNPNDYDTCGLDADFTFVYFSNPPGTLTNVNKFFYFYDDSDGTYLASVREFSYLTKSCGSSCYSCQSGGKEIDCPPTYYYYCSSDDDSDNCFNDVTCFQDHYETIYKFICNRERPAGYVRLSYKFSTCASTDVDKTFDCDGIIIDMSEDKPFADLPFIKEKCAKPTKAPTLKPTKAPKTPKTPKPKKPRQLESTETSDVHSVEEMNNLEEAIPAPTKEDANIY